jgi:hypothetical protein
LCLSSQQNDAIRWNEALPPFGTVGILGKKGQGKSVLAYYLAEIRHQTTGTRVAALGPPFSFKDILPDWITIVGTLPELMEHVGSILVMDEGSMNLHSRRTMSKQSVEMDQAMSLTRQNEQLFIWCTHNSKKMDPMVMRDLDMLAYKTPSTMHVKMERSEIKSFTAEARKFLMQEEDPDRRKTLTVVYYDDFDERAILKNGVPSFWSEDLSKAVAVAQTEQNSLGEIDGPVREVEITQKEYELVRLLRQNQSGLNMSSSFH